MKIIIDITTGIMFKERVEFDYENFEEFKVELLKRWGNIAPKAPNKSAKEYQKVKNIIYKSDNLEELIEEINIKTRWNFSYIARG